MGLLAIHWPSTRCRLELDRLYRGGTWRRGATCPAQPCVWAPSCALTNYLTTAKAHHVQKFGVHRSRDLLIRFDLRSTFIKMVAYALQDMCGHVAFVSFVSLVSLVSLCQHTFTAI